MPEPGAFVARVAVAGASNRADLGRSLAGASVDGRFTLPLARWDELSDWFGTYRAEGAHAGVDLGLQDGAAEPVLAACDGAVTVAQYDDGYGYHIELDCGDGWSTLYAHLSELIAAPGDRVRKGDWLGLTGSTGFSTGEHLHFEILLHGSPVDPELYLDFGPHSGEGGLPGPPEEPLDSAAAEPLTATDTERAEPQPPAGQATPELTPEAPPSPTASPATATPPPAAPTPIAVPGTPTPVAPAPAPATATASPSPSASPSPTP